MSERPIPEDVMAVARHEAQFFADWLHHGNSTGSLSEHAIAGLADSIARALMDERERGRIPLPPRTSLTLQQKRLFDFIASYSDKNGYCPSFDEILDAMGLRSKSCIHRLLVALEERGFIRRIPHRARAIEIVAEARA